MIFRSSDECSWTALFYKPFICYRIYSRFSTVGYFGHMSKRFWFELCYDPSLSRVFLQQLQHGNNTYEMIKIFEAHCPPNRSFRIGYLQMCRSCNFGAGDENSWTWEWSEWFANHVISYQSSFVKYFVELLKAVDRICPGTHLLFMLFFWSSSISSCSFNERRNRRGF